MPKRKNEELSELYELRRNINDIESLKKKLESKKKEFDKAGSSFYAYGMQSVDNYAKELKNFEEKKEKKVIGIKSIVVFLSLAAFIFVYVISLMFFSANSVYMESMESKEVFYFVHTVLALIIASIALFVCFKDIKSIYAFVITSICAVVLIITILAVYLPGVISENIANQSLNTPEILQTYVGEKSYCDVTLKFVSCSEDGRVTATCEIKNGKYEGRVILIGNIVHKKSNGDVRIEWESQNVDYISEDLSWTDLNDVTILKDYTIFSDGSTILRVEDVE